MADLNDDIARYLGGRMSPAEMHALEMRALDDPFLAEAIAGGESLPESAFSNDVSQLQNLIRERADSKATGALVEGTSGRGKQVSMWSWPTRIAAGFLLVASVGVVLFFISDKPSEELALNTTSESVVPPPPTLQEPVTDSLLSGHTQLSDRTQRLSDASRDGDAALTPSSSSESLSKNKQQPSASAPKPSPQREEIAGATSGNGAASKNAEEPLDARQLPADELAKTQADQAARDVAGRVAGAQLHSATPDAVKRADSSKEIDAEAEVAPLEEAKITANNDAATSVDKARSQNEVATQQNKTKSIADDAKDDKADQVSKKERVRKTQPATTTVPGEVTESKQTFAAKAADSKLVYSGKVVDAEGEGIPGVNIVIKGTNTGTVTDIHGNYQLSVPDAKPTLVYTFIGYSNHERVADAGASATVRLEEDLTQLSEVVVAGYGAERIDDPVTPVFDFANPNGGKRAFKQYLEKNLHYPKEALLNQVEGRVTIQFSVETTGSLSEFRVLKGIGSGCDEEVIRLIKAGPKWNPTKRDEVAERSTVKVRMRFQLPKDKK